MIKKIKRYVFGRMERFKSLSKTQKNHIFLLLLTLCFFPSKLILEWKGRDFPSESELHYSEGILAYEGFGITLKSIEDPSKRTIFSCHYTAFTTRDSGRCMDRKYIKPYLDRPAKIGWYYQTSFLGFTNDFPQLVSLAVDGKKIKSYEKTLKTTNNINKQVLFLFLFANIFWTWIFMKIVYPRDILYKGK